MVSASATVEGATKSGCRRGCAGALLGDACFSGWVQVGRKCCKDRRTPEPHTEKSSFTADARTGTSTLRSRSTKSCRGAGTAICAVHGGRTGEKVEEGENSARGRSTASGCLPRPQLAGSGQLGMIRPPQGLGRQRRRRRPGSCRPARTSRKPILARACEVLQCRLVSARGGSRARRRRRGTGRGAMRRRACIRR